MMCDSTKCFFLGGKQAQGTLYIYHGAHVVVFFRMSFCCLRDDLYIATALESVGWCQASSHYVLHGCGDDDRRSLVHYITTCRVETAQPLVTTSSWPGNSNSTAVFGCVHRWQVSMSRICLVAVISTSSARMDECLLNACRSFLLFFLCLGGFIFIYVQKLSASGIPACCRDLASGTIYEYSIVLFCAYIYEYSIVLFCAAH